VRNFTAAAPNRVWLADITYIPTAEGWLYLEAVIDLFSRKIVGWAMRDARRTSFSPTIRISSNGWMRASGATLGVATTIAVGAHFLTVCCVQHLFSMAATFATFLGLCCCASPWQSISRRRGEYAARIVSADRFSDAALSFLALSAEWCCARHLGELDAQLPPPAPHDFARFTHNRMRRNRQAERAAYVCIYVGNQLGTGD
jgi:transposase InsO family protein